MKAYVINLARRTDRLRYISGEFSQAGLSFERVEAVDGQTLSDDDIRLHRAYPNGLCYKLNRAHIGCHLSHKLAWSKFLQTAEPFAAIFEDDVHLGRGIAELLETAKDCFPEKAHVIKLDTWGTPIRLYKNESHPLETRQLFRLAGRHYGAAGYIVSREGAKCLLTNSGKLSFGVDALLFDPRLPLKPAIRVFQLDPAIVGQDNLRGIPENLCQKLTSDIGNQTECADKSYGCSPWQIAKNRMKDRLRAFRMVAERVLKRTVKRVICFE